MGQAVVFSHGWPLSSDAWEDRCSRPINAELLAFFRESMEAAS
jgi:hypothetical protein